MYKKRTLKDKALKGWLEAHLLGVATKEEFAKSLGVSERQLRRYLMRESDLKWDMMISMCLEVAKLTNQDRWQILKDMTAKLSGWRDAQ